MGKTIDLSLSLFAESLSIPTGTVLLSMGMIFRSSAPALIQWLIWTISTAFPASLSHLYLEALYYSELPFINQPVLLAIILQRVSSISFNQRRCLWTFSLVITTISRTILFFDALALWPNTFAEFCFFLLRLLSGSLIPTGLLACLSAPLVSPDLFFSLRSVFSCPVAYFSTSFPISGFSVCPSFMCPVIFSSGLWTWTWVKFFQSQPLTWANLSHTHQNTYPIFIICSSGTLRGT